MEMGLVGSGGGVLLGSGGWLGGASWDIADLMQRVNNLPMWIGPRLFRLVLFCSSLFDWRSDFDSVLFLGWLCSVGPAFLVWGIAVSGASLDFAVSPAVVLAATFRAGF